MKAKKIIVILIILSGLGAGGYFFQKYRDEKALVEHNKKKFLQMKETARKSSSAGLVVMATAINKFHTLNRRYPKTLTELYPDFIPDKGFITDLNWAYIPKGKTYLIKRRAKGQKLYASMGPSMRLQTGRMDEPAKPMVAAGAGPGISEPVKMAAIETPGTEPGSPLSPTPGATAPSAKKPEEKTQKGKEEPTTEPSIHIVRTQLKKEEAFLTAFDGSRIYIWKTRDGIVGFSNIQYPEGRQLTIYRDRGWIEYTMNKEPL